MLRPVLRNKTKNMPKLMHRKCPQTLDTGSRVRNRLQALRGKYQCISHPRSQNEVIGRFSSPQIIPNNSHIVMVCMRRTTPRLLQKMPKHRRDIELYSSETLSS